MRSVALDGCLQFLQYFQKSSTQRHIVFWWPLINRSTEQDCLWCCLIFNYGMIDIMWQLVSMLDLCTHFSKNCFINSLELLSTSACCRQTDTWDCDDCLDLSVHHDVSEYSRVCRCFVECTEVVFMHLYVNVHAYIQMDSHSVQVFDFYLSQQNSSRNRELDLVVFRWTMGAEGATAVCGLAGWKLFKGGEWQLSYERGGEIPVSLDQCSAPRWNLYLLLRLSRALNNEIRTYWFQLL